MLLYTYVKLDYLRVYIKLETPSLKENVDEHIIFCGTEVVQMGLSGKQSQSS